jgi:acyl carrier protein
MTQVEQEVRQFISDNFFFVREVAELDGGESLTKSGLIDSTGIVELIVFLETNFGVEVAEEETVPDNMDTIDRIVRYVHQKLEAGDVAKREDHVENTV